MATRILLRPRPFALGFGISGLAVAHTFITNKRSFSLCCDSPSTRSWPQSNEARTPIIKGGNLNPGAVRQMSTGSILGLLGGIAVGTFSKTIAFLIGIGVVGVQWAASYGINIVPYDRIQRYVKGIDLRSLIEDNMAFKIAFGSTFALAAFVDL